ANQNAFTHGWFRSGDEGFFKIDALGQSYFFISGRYKELIIRGGVKISPLELDEVLCGIPSVKAAMAVGFEHVTYGEEVGAYVVPKPGSGLTAEAVLSACRARLPSWMCPKAVVFGERFPVTSTGKYQRNQLKPLFAARALEIQASKDDDVAHIAAHDEIEAELLKLWKQTLGVSKIRITDDLFALGGNSMIAASIISRIEQRFGTCHVLSDADYCGPVHTLEEGRLEAVMVFACADANERLASAVLLRASGWRKCLVLPRSGARSG
ncbi:MAG TPA: non-ribosomal peptide synthetase, partial [Planctomycetota bacterium]